jgi:hypothetical protein
VIDGSRARREMIAPGQLLGMGQRTKADIANDVLVCWNTKLAVIEAKAWDKAGAHRGPGPGQELRGQAIGALHVQHEQASHPRRRRLRAP